MILIFFCGAKTKKIQAEMSGEILIEGGCDLFDHYHKQILFFFFFQFKEGQNCSIKKKIPFHLIFESKVVVIMVGEGLGVEEEGDEVEEEEVEEEEVEEVVEEVEEEEEGEVVEEEGLVVVQK